MVKEVLGDDGAVFGAVVTGAMFVVPAGTAVVLFAGIRKLFSVDLVKVPPTTNVPPEAGTGEGGGVTEGAEVPAGMVFVKRLVVLVIEYKGIEPWGG